MFCRRHPRQDNVVAIRGRTTSSPSEAGRRRRHPRQDDIVAIRGSTTSSPSEAARRRKPNVQPTNINFVPTPVIMMNICNDASAHAPVCVCVCVYVRACVRACVHTDVCAQVSSSLKT